MATHFSPCSSSSSSSSSLTFSSEFTVCKPRRYCFSKWVSQVHPRIHARNHFRIKSSNGHPPNAVSMQDGQSLYFIAFLSCSVRLLLSLWSKLAFTLVNLFSVSNVICSLPAFFWNRVICGMKYAALTFKIGYIDILDFIYDFLKILTLCANMCLVNYY